MQLELCLSPRKLLTHTHTLATSFPLPDATKPERFMSKENPSDWKEMEGNEPGGDW